MSKPRYLTASKIGLLVLVKLYCNSNLPSSATIPILSFVLSHTFPTAPSAARSPRTGEQPDVSLSVRSFKDVLQEHASSMPGRTLLDDVLKNFWEMKSIDSLFDLFDDLGGLLPVSREDLSSPKSPGHIYLSITSPLGALVRRARLEFARLPFDDIIHLWCAFIAYRAPTFHWVKRPSGLSSSDLDVVATDMGLSPKESLFEVSYGRLLGGDDTARGLSVDDLDRVLEFQLDRLQRKYASRGLGCRVPEEMKASLRSLIESSEAVPRQMHLVMFFDAWKSGDYSSAFDSLHRYFDYAMQVRERIHYQYALLHMAILQADFACFEEAVAAINETIVTARENQDIHCLNFSLNWLNHMAKTYPKQMQRAGYIGMMGSEKEGLTFLKAKAKEAKTYTLLSATLLNEAKLCLLSGDLIPRALEHLYQSSHLSLKESIGNHGSHLLFQSALFSRLGSEYMSEVNCQLLLDCYQHGCPLDEQLRAIGRRSFLILHKGRYDDTLILLRSMDQFARGSLKFRQYQFLCTGIAKLKRAIHQADWVACEALLSHLQPDASTDPELIHLLSDLRINYLVSRGLYTQAWETLEKLSVELKGEGFDVMQRTLLLITQAILYRRTGHPERGFSVTLRAACVAFKARLETCLSTAVGLLANTLVSNGDYSAAIRLLSAILPKSLENGDMHSTGTLYALLGDAYIGLAGVSSMASPTRLRLRAMRVSRAEMYIDRARKCFQKVEDVEGECEQVMKKAVIARLRGDEDLAAEWALKHKRAWEHGIERIASNSAHGG